jgi:membrane protease YdiL (CAAX protease family)
VVLLAWALLGTQVALVNVLAAPWAEETLARWGLQDELLDRRKALLNEWQRAFRSAACTACAFAALHVLLRPDLLSVAAGIPAFVIGIVYARTRALAVCVFMHASFNFFWFGAIAPFGFNFN